MTGLSYWSNIVSLSYWNNLVTDNFKIKFVTSTNLIYGYPCKITVRTIMASSLRSTSGRPRSLNRLKLQEYVRNNKIRTYVAAMNVVCFFQDEEVLQGLFKEFPDLIDGIIRVCVPSSDEACKLLKEGYSLLHYKSTWNKRVLIGSGIYKEDTIGRLIALDESGSIRVSDSFRRAKYRLLDEKARYLNSGIIYINDDKYLTLFRLLDERLVKNVVNIIEDPGLVISDE
jgi:hypothetical protein